MARIAIHTYSSEDIFNINKMRFNSHQGGYGVTASAYDKARNRNSKMSKKNKYELKQLCY